MKMQLSSCVNEWYKGALYYAPPMKDPTIHVTAVSCSFQKMLDKDDVRCYNNSCLSAISSVGRAPDS